MSLVQARSSNGAFASGLNGTIAFSSNVTAGNMLLAAMRSGSATPFLNIDDNVNAGVDYTTVVGDYDVGAARSRMTYFLNTAGGADTVQYNWTVTATPRAHQLEFSAIATSSALDQSANATGTGTALTAGAVTVTITTLTQFIFAFFSVSADVTFSQSAPWTLVTGTNSPDTRTCFVYQEVSASGTYTPAVTASSSVTWLGQTASFISTNSAGAASLPPGLGPSLEMDAAQQSAMSAMMR